MRLYLGSIDQYIEPDCFNGAVESLYRAGLSSRAEKVLGHRVEKVRLLELAASCALMKALAEAGISDPEILTGERGKPYLCGRPQFRFNISHSKGYAVCAVAEFPAESDIGVDIQAITTDKEGIAARFFSEAENIWLSSVAAADRNDAFTRLWTLKEAYIKLTGEGLSHDLASFSIIPGASGVGLTDTDSSIDVGSVRFHEVVLPGYHLSVATYSV